MQKGVIMKKFIPLIVIYSTELFFVIASIMGFEYNGSESSSIYIVFTLVVFLLGIILGIVDLVFKRTKYRINHLILLYIPIIISLLFLVYKGKYSSKSFADNNYLYFLIWGVPSILIGSFISNQNRLKDFIKYLEPLMLIFTFAISIGALDVLLSGQRFISLGGTTYQTASYISAFSFGINIYFLISDSIEDRFKFTRTSMYKIFSYFLLFVQVISVFITGGRGGMVLVVVYLGYFILINFHPNKHLMKSLKYIAIFLGVFLVFLMILPTLLEIPSFNNSFQRVFSYISEDGIDWTETSNRDIVYRNAIQLIKASPIVGYGYYGYWQFSMNPHNLFLEVLLQGGILYLALFIFLLILLVNKYFNMKRGKSTEQIIEIIALYPFTMLMFSGTYTNNSVFWFVISYIISYRMPYKPKALNDLKAIEKYGHIL